MRKWKEKKEEKCDISEVKKDDDAINRANEGRPSGDELIDLLKKYWVR